MFGVLLFYTITFKKGLIPYRTYRYGETEKGALVIASSGNYDQFDFFCSENKPNSWFGFDFKKKPYFLYRYTIQTRNLERNDNHPKSWVIEGSKTKLFWTVLDRKENCSDLNGPNITVEFQIDHSLFKRSFRYFRIRQTGLNWNGNDFLTFESFHLEGATYYNYQD